MYLTTKSGVQLQFSNSVHFQICCSVAESCLTICDPMDCRMPGFPVLHCLPEFSQTRVHWVGEPSNYLILCCLLSLMVNRYILFIFSNLVFGFTNMLLTKWIVICFIPFKIILNTLVIARAYSLLRMQRSKTVLCESMCLSVSCSVAQLCPTQRPHGL